MTKKHVPRKKGGAVFPRIALEEAVGYAKKLVAKTHTGPLTPDILFPGVFGARGARAEIRASALKQYGFLKGTKKEGYQATDSAKRLVHASGSELEAHLRTAVLGPKVFAGLYDTFHGDSTLIGKIRQQAANLNVHPDNVENCAEMFVRSLVYGGLASRDGDQIRIGADVEPSGSEDEADEASDRGATGAREGGEQKEGREGKVIDRGLSEAEMKGKGKAVIHVNVTLDSSMDIEKLERQLELLRRYGAL